MINAFNQFLDRHGFSLLPEESVPSVDPKTIELRLKLLENDLGIDPNKKPEEPPPAVETKEEENAPVV